MITFILPGYSPTNREWADEVAKGLSLDGQIRPTYWDHWDDDSQRFKPTEKAELIIRHSKGDSINIVAKSVGTLVAALIAQKIPDQINKIILCGIPTVSDARLEISKAGFSTLPPENILVFQNKKDPFAKDFEVAKYFREVNPKIKVLSKDRSDHNYPYYLEFQEFLSK